MNEVEFLKNFGPCCLTMAQSHSSCLFQYKALKIFDPPNIQFNRGILIKIIVVANKKNLILALFIFIDK